jgi:hypothetical protein
MKRLVCVLRHAFGSALVCLGLCQLALLSRAAMAGVAVLKLVRLVYIRCICKDHRACMFDACEFCLRQATCMVQVTASYVG